MADERKQTRQPRANRVDERSKKLAEKRKKRQKVEGGFRSKLAVPEFLKEDGYNFRWVNDLGNRIVDMLSRGWEYVENTGHDIGEDLSGGNIDIGNRIGVYAGTKANGQPLIMYLMKIEEELYKEDFEAKQERVDRIEDQITGKNKSAREALANGEKEYQDAKISHKLSA